MRSAFSQCAGIIILAIAVSGCAGGKWPWQSSSPFNASNTPSSTNVAGATKPSTLANNPPPSGVTAPAVTYPTYAGSAPGMNAGNNFAPAYQPTNPPTGPSNGTYTASSNNAASRTGASIAPQQGTYQTGPTVPSAACPPTGSFGTTPGAGYGATPNAAYGTNPSSSYGTTPSAGYGTPPASGGTALPTSAYGGSSSAVPSASSYPRGTPSASTPLMNPASLPPGPVTGNYDAGWSSPPGNPVRQTSPSVGTDRYSSASDRYGSGGGTDRYDAAAGAAPVATTDARYGNLPPSTPDPRYGNLPPASMADPRYGNLPPASTPDARFAPPADNSRRDPYGTGALPAATPGDPNPPPPTGGTVTLSVPSAGTTSATASANPSSPAYQPGSVSAYEATKPAAVTASSPAAPTAR